MTLPSTEVVNLVASAGRVAWTGCVPNPSSGPISTCPPDRATTEVWVTDAGTGRSRAVASTRYPQGQISWVGLSASTIVWLDQTGVPDDAHPTSGWAIRACRLAGACEPISLGSSPDSTPPLFTVRDDWVTWLQPSARWVAGAAAGDIVTARTDGGGRRVLLEGVLAGTATYDGSTLVYEGPPIGDGPEVERREIFVRSGAGRGPGRPVTGRAQAARPSFQDGVLTWAEPLDGEGTQLWAATPTSAPVLLRQAPTLESIAGTGFVAQSALDGHLTAVALPDQGAAWPTPTARSSAPSSAPVLASPPTSDEASVVVDLGVASYVPAHFAVDGDRVYFATSDGRTVLLHSVTLDP